jgi:hypothetical protein
VRSDRNKSQDDESGSSLPSCRNRHRGAISGNRTRVLWVLQELWAMMQRIRTIIWVAVSRTTAVGPRDSLPTWRGTGSVRCVAQMIAFWGLADLILACQLEQLRIQERKQAIAQGLIADPDKPTSLENAIEFVGTCTEMCPLFEREEREYKKNVHPLEQVSLRDVLQTVDSYATPPERRATWTYRSSEGGHDVPSFSSRNRPASPH